MSRVAKETSTQQLEQSWSSRIGLRAHPDDPSASPPVSECDNGWNSRPALCSTFPLQLLRRSSAAPSHYQPPFFARTLLKTWQCFVKNNYISQVFHIQFLDKNSSPKGMTAKRPETGEHICYRISFFTKMIIMSSSAKLCSACVLSPETVKYSICHRKGSL